MSKGYVAGARVTYGTRDLSDQGSRLGEVRGSRIRRGEEEVLIAPLSIETGDGTAPVWIPATRIIGSWRPGAWTYSLTRNTYHRTRS